MGNAKLLVMQIAAILTQAAMGARGGAGASAATIDPTNQDPTQRGLNLQAWEVFRAFYAGITGAVADDKNWVPPSGGTPAVPAGLIQTLAQPAIAALIAGNPTLAPLAAVLKGLIPLPAGPVTALPSPADAVASPVATK